MYEIQRKGRITEELKITDGDKVLTLSVDINVDKIIADYSNALSALQAAKNDKTNPQRVGECVIALLRLIFGDEQTTELVTFYQNGYTELLLDLAPFIAEKITPRVNEVSAARKAALVAAAKRR